MSPDNTHEETAKRIIISKNGPYKVQGNIPLVHKTQVVSEHGEPLTWQTDGPIETPKDEYTLCRCGLTSTPPFCDRTHRSVPFDGTELAETSLREARVRRFPRGTRIIVEKDPSLCMQSGFCGLKNIGMNQLLASTEDTKIRSLVMAMVERCPSGSLSYRIEENTPDVEPDLPQQIAVTTEITSEGPIAGPLWVTGGILVERSDGQPMEIRNRVTLCNCGHSSCKPLCDGSHRLQSQREIRHRWAQK